MAEPIAAYGNEVGICGHDGDDWVKVVVDEDGYLQVAVDSTGDPPNLDITISALRDAICAAAPTGNDLADLYTRLGSILTELESKLETSDLNLDAEKDLQVDVKSVPTTTVQAAGGDKIFSFESIVEENVADTNLDAGVNNLDGAAVDTGKVWMVTHAAMIYIGTPPSWMRITVEGLAGGIQLIYQANPVSSQPYPWSGQIYMQQNDYMRITVPDATEGDTMRLKYTGVQMDAPA